MNATSQAEMDDRAKLRSLFEGLRGRLNDREREAAVLCYLQGLSRSEAASRMGVSETRMRKLMEGRGPGRPGVSWKVGALVDTIRSGGWCEEQGSLIAGWHTGCSTPTASATVSRSCIAASARRAAHTLRRFAA